MWAGVITHISKTLDKVFGKWSIKLFRMWYFDSNDLDPFLDEDVKTKKTKKHWKFSHKKLAILFFLLFLIGGFIALWVIYGTPSVTDEEGASTSDVMTILLSALVASTLVSHTSSIFKVVS